MLDILYATHSHAGHQEQVYSTHMLVLLEGRVDLDETLEDGAVPVLVQAPRIRLVVDVDVGNAN